MKKLDLVKINSCAPYAVKEDTQEGAYTFIADSGAEFSIGKPPIQRKVGWMKNIIFAAVLKFI